MKNPMKTKCLHCQKDISVKELLAEAKVLNEEAILTCPVCGTEMELTAVLKSMPGENDDFVADDGPGGPGGPDDMGGEAGGIFDDLEDNDTEPNGMLDGEADDDVEFQEIEDEEDEDEDEDEDDVEESRLRVYLCESCRRNWLSSSKIPCPECKEENVVLTDKSISEALVRVLKEVNTGVPVSRAVDKLFPELAEVL
jgi:hypothetical protein